VGRHLYDDVGIDAPLLGVFLAVDALAVGQVVVAGGQFDEGVAVGEREDHLHRAFAKGALADDGGAAEVLEGAGDDFGGAGGVLIDEDDDGEVDVIDIAVGTDFGRGIGGFALGEGGNDQSLVHELVDDVGGGGHQAAGVVAQVDDDPAGV